MTTWLGETIVQALEGNKIDDEDRAAIRDATIGAIDVHDLAGILEWIKTASDEALASIGSHMYEEQSKRRIRKAATDAAARNAEAAKYGLSGLDPQMSPHYYGSNAYVPGSTTWHYGDVVETSNDKSILPVAVRNLRGHVTNSMRNNYRSAKVAVYFPSLGIAKRIDLQHLTVIHKVK